MVMKKVFVYHPKKKADLFHSIKTTKNIVRTNLHLLYDKLKITVAPRVEAVVADIQVALLEVEHRLVADHHLCMQGEMSTATTTTMTMTMTTRPQTTRRTMRVFACLKMKKITK